MELNLLTFIMSEYIMISAETQIKHCKLRVLLRKGSGPVVHPRSSSTELGPQIDDWAGGRD